MIFELTDSLVSDILFAMEDQTNTSFVDAQTASLVSKDSALNSGGPDSERFYALPEWTSGDGYALLVSFTENLHSPLAHTELKNVLDSGRGVFRNFKDVLKAYPQIERKWHFYKNKCMKKRIAEWYAFLRESWGLEALSSSSEDFLEETDELLQSDFTFNSYSSVRDNEDVERGKILVAEEFKTQYEGELGNAAAFLWQQVSALAAPENKMGFVCRTQSEEFAGCVLAAFCPSQAKKTVVLTDCFVLHDYRGLGIGRELFSQSLALLKQNGIQWVLLGNSIIPQEMEPLLDRLGFKRSGSCYMADLILS